MTAPTMRPEEALRQAFDELDQANRLVEEQSMAQAEAQKQVAKTSALQTETQHQLKNAEAKYRVLLGSAELAAPDIQALQARYAERERDLDVTLEELEVAEVEAENARRSRQALEELTAAEGAWLETARDVALILRRSADRCDTVSPGAAVRAALRGIAQELHDHHTQFQDRLGELEQVLQQMRMAAEGLPMVTVTPAHLIRLTAKRELLERELAEIGDALTAKQANVDVQHLQEAKTELIALRRTAEEVPKAVQGAQYKLQMATDSLKQAENSRQDRAEQLRQWSKERIVPGIEVIAPNAAGFVTAQAQLAYQIPEGYTLRWQVGEALVESATGEKISIDARKLPIGDTAIEANLERQPTNP